MNGKAKIRNCLRPHRNGIAMIIVMVAVAFVFVIGMSVLAGVPASTRISNNQIDRDAALYLAESGLAEALYRLADPPGGAPGIWAGAAGRTLTGVSGSYSVGVTDLGGGVYQIRATGIAPGHNGITVTHVATMTVQVDPIAVNYPLRGNTTIGAGTILPPGSEFEGDVSVVGNVTNLGDVDGTLHATGLVISLLPGQADAVAPLSTDIASPPVIDLNEYRQYVYQGQIYDAMVVTQAEVNSLPQTLQPTTASNPLGIVVIDGNFELGSNDLTIDDGILVVMGDITMNNDDLRVDGKSGHFSLLVQGDLIFDDDSEVRTDVGPAYIKGQIRTAVGASNDEADFRGGLVSVGTLPATFPGSFHVRDDNSNPSAIMDVQYFGGAIGSSTSNAVTQLTYTIGSGG